MGHCGLSNYHLRTAINTRLCRLPLTRVISRTMVQGRNYGPQIRVKRIASGLESSIHLLTQPYTYLHLPIQPYTYIHLPTQPYTYIHLPTQPYTYLHLLTQPYTYIHNPHPTSQLNLHYFSAISTIHKSHYTLAQIAPTLLPRYSLSATLTTSPPTFLTPTILHSTLIISIPFPASPANVSRFSCKPPNK